jgi:hypothetical protein
MKLSADAEYAIVSVPSCRSDKISHSIPRRRESSRRKSWAARGGTHDHQEAVKAVVIVEDIVCDDCAHRAEAQQRALRSVPCALRTIRMRSSKERPEKGERDVRKRENERE